MESFFDLCGIYSQEFFKFSNFSFGYVACGSLLLFSAAVVFILSIFYNKIRRFPVKVNCWFCNNNTSVPRDLANSWNCPHCKQYNGFNEDGSYNRVIEEQYNPKLNKDVFNALKPSHNKTSSQGFCKLCNINQQLKIQQLALFTPIDEDNYYEEIEKYREKLEKAYSLCSMCEGVLKETLEKQEYNLLQKRLNNHKQSFYSQPMKTFKKVNKKKLMQLIHKNGVTALNWICLLIALLQFFVLIIKFNTEHHILSLSLPEFKISKLALKSLLPEIYGLNRELSFAGFVFCLLACALNQVKKNHNNILVWGLLHISFWSTLIGVQIVLSGICVCMTAKAAQKQFIYINKKLLHKKSGFEPVKKVFSEVYNISSNGTDTIEQVLSPPLKNENLGFFNQKLHLKENTIHQNENIRVKEKSDVEKPKRKPRKEDNEEDSLMKPEKVEHSPESAGQTSPPLNSSSFNKSFLASLDKEKIEGDISTPFSEVYNGLNSLHLGGKQKKSNKSTNFLFSSPDFSTSKNSIIKPAKFIKNLNSTSWSESVEYNSRSSTPSSQKTEKGEPNRYDFFKPMMPISVSPFNRQSRINCWDYDGSGLYNNFNYFPHGFLPFQQFPSSLGHTTIYTSTRPTNFPYPFSPWQGFASPKFSPTSRFSDSSDCDNLFQDTSKNFEKRKKWFKLKRFSYYFSLLINIFTLTGLFYFISTGIILVDWKLPTLNFFQ